MKLFTKIKKIYIILPLILFCVFFVIPKISSANEELSLNAFQVKVANNPTVYYLDYSRKIKKAYLSEESFLSYGNKWSDVVEISQNELNNWRNAYLIKVDNNKTVYYINGVNKAIIKNEKEFTKNGFKWEDIIVVNEIDLSSYTLINFDLMFKKDNSGRLLINICETSPESYFIPLNTKDNLVAVFNFKAEESIVEIKNLSIKLNGVFDNQIIKNIRLVDENIENYEVLASISNRIINFSLYSNPIVIPVGQEKKIKIFVDLGYYENIENNTFWLNLEDSDFINTEAKILANFPLESNVMELIDAENLLGEVEIEQTAVIDESNVAIIGNTDRILAKYKISEISKNENIVIKELIFKNLGSARGSDISNFKLKNNNGEIVAQVNRMDDNKIKFVINDCMVNKNNFDYFTVYGNTIGGEGETIQLRLDKIKILGENFGFSLPVGIVNIEEIIIIKREMLGVISMELKSSKKVFSEQSGTMIGLFEIRSDNQNIALENLEISLSKSISSPSLEETIFLINYITGETISSTNNNNFGNIPITLELNDMNLKAKNEIYLALVTEISTNIKNGDYYKATLNTITYQAENGVYYSDEVNIGGEILTISRSSLYVYDNDSVGESSCIKGQKKVKIASFVLEASAGYDAKINSITFSKGNTSGSVTYDNGFSNMSLYIGSSKVGSTIQRPYSDSWTFNDFNYKLRSGRRVDVKIFIDIDKDLNVSETKLKISELVAFSYDSNIKSNVFGLNTNSYKTVFGNVKSEINSIAGGSVFVGENNNFISSFKVKNSGDDDLRLKYLTINTSSDGFSYSLGYSNLKIVRKDNGRRVGSRLSRPVAGANRIRLNNHRIEVGEEIIFEVYVDAGFNVPTGSFQMYLSDFEIEGYISDIESQINKNITDNVTVTVN